MYIYIILNTFPFIASCNGYSLFQSICRCVHLSVSLCLYWFLYVWLLVSVPCSASMFASYICRRVCRSVLRVAREMESSDIIEVLGWFASDCRVLLLLLFLLRNGSILGANEATRRRDRFVDATDAYLGQPGPWQVMCTLMSRTCRRFSPGVNSER